MSEKRCGQPDRDLSWNSLYFDAELDEAEQEGGIEDELHDADTERDGDPLCCRWSCPGASSSGLFYVRVGPKENALTVVSRSGLYANATLRHVSARPRYAAALIEGLTVTVPLLGLAGWALVLAAGKAANGLQRKRSRPSAQTLRIRAATSFRG